MENSKQKKCLSIQDTVDAFKDQGLTPMERQVMFIEERHNRKITSPAYFELLQVYFKK